MKGSLRSRVLKKCEEMGYFVYFCDKLKSGGYKIKVDKDFDEKKLEEVCKVVKVKKSSLGDWRGCVWEMKSVFVEEL